MINAALDPANIAQKGAARQAMVVHIVKLCVGADNIEDLALWQRSQMAEQTRLGLQPRPVCGTHARPKRKAGILAGGSLFWVIKGVILVRQRIVEIGNVVDERGARCGLYLDPHLVSTHPQPRRAFQGWRYLTPEDAPPDLVQATGACALPEPLRRALLDAGVW